MAWLALLVSHILGPNPSAVNVSRRAAGVDIRALGDGNMGARNVKRSIGWQPAIVVAVMDFAKGAVAVLLARALGLSVGWQVASAMGFPSSPGSAAGRVSHAGRVARSVTCGRCNRVVCLWHPVPPDAAL
jgi:glycerol-3-phosphate acyltransferase PlsY